MKKNIVVIAGLVCSLCAVAQTKPKPKTPTATPAPFFKNSTDSLSYAIGMNAASFFKEKGLTNINGAMVAKAFDDVLKADKAKLTQQQCQTVLVSTMQKIEADKTSVVKKQGIAFLEENKKKAGVIALPSGLQYIVLKEGTGIKPSATDKVKVHYHGTLIDGTVFDSSVDRGEPIVLGVNQVIPGWTEALQLMPVGSKWRLFIPSELAYGDRDAGPTIKGGSTLIFDVELIDIEPQDSTNNK
jgi:FKBP-type peptidyl-prolyl cis-trans isomerase FklB